MKLFCGEVVERALPDRVAQGPQVRTPKNTKKKRSFPRKKSEKKASGGDQVGFKSQRRITQMKLADYSIFYSILSAADYSIFYLINFLFWATRGYYDSAIFVDHYFCTRGPTDIEPEP